ncbi:serine-protein kinase ATM [Panulirus ornatus]|uniref:serine-protein kinase ATM n=1 Tax=Panulirus ornatus TaxID=150431 RepID=UPI003A84D78F
MALDDLKQCCLQLDSDRVTDRKKGSDQLKHLLNNDRLVRYLNTKQDGFNWNQVFYSAKSFFLKEARRVEEEERKKPEVSQTVLSNRANLKRFAAVLPKLVLKKASLKTPHVSARMVTDLVLTVLDRSRPYLLENFAGDIIQITQRYLLRFPQYYLELSATKWRDVLKMCIWVYENDLPNTDAVSAIEVLEGIVKCCRVRGHQYQKFNPFLVLRPLPSFLKKALTDSKLSSRYGLQSNILSLLLTFTKALASEWRYILCSVGEETFMPVLTMWEDRPSSRQTHWLEYVNLQILIHHPQKGGKLCQESSFSYDPVKWQRCLHRLYQLIHDHLDQLQMKIKLTPASSLSVEQFTIPPLLVTLAARLCHKVFDETEGYGVLDLTQQGSTQLCGMAGKKPYKRRKIEVGLQPLALMLREEGTQLHRIPWYQILHELLKSHSLFFHQARCSQMLEVFTHILSECRKPAVQEYILWCLEALAHQYNRVYPQNETKSDLRHGKWMPVWDLTLRLVSGKQCSRYGMELLQTLMNTELVYPSSAVFKLFLQGHTDMNETAISTLLISLSLMPLPKHFKNESAVLSEDQVKDARLNLLDALLPLQNEGGAVMGSLDSVASLENPLLLAQLLLILRHRDPRCAQDETKCLTECTKKRADNRGDMNFLTHLEDMYLLSSFSCDIPKSHHLKRNATVLKRSTREWKILPKEEENILQRVIIFVDQVASEDILTTPNGLQVVLKVMHLIMVLLLHISDQRLEEKLQQMINLMASGIDIIYAEPESSRWVNLRKVLVCLHHLYLMVKSWTSCQEPAAAVNGQRLQELLISSTPSALFALIVGLVKTRTEKSVNSSGHLGSSQISSSGRSSFNQGAASDSFDMDFDDPDAGSLMEDIDEFQQFEDDIDDSSGDECLVLEDVGTFRLRDQCFILAIQWLTVASQFSAANEGEENSVSLFEVINLLLEFSKYSSLEMVDVAVILKSVHALFTAKYDEENIKDGFEILSYICKKHSSDSQVASYVVKIMADLISVNGSCLSGTIQSIIVKLAKAFAQKLLEGNYWESVSEAIILLNCELSKVDPKRVWSKYGLPDNSRCGEVYDYLCSPSFELRILAASFIHILLVRGDGTLMDMPHQDKIFQEVYQTILEALTVHNTLPGNFMSDEAGNRKVSFLLTLGIIAHNSPYLEAKALFALCLAVPEHDVDSSLVSRLVGRVAASQGHSLKGLVHHHLPYLATQWVQHNHDITAFPAILLEATSQETFLHENKNILLPVLYECDQSPAIDILAQSCGKEVSELLRENFPTLMAHIFPYVAAEPNELMVSQLQNMRVQAAKRHYKSLERSFGNDVFSRLIDEHIGDMMLSLVKLVHDPYAMVEEEVIVEPNPPHFSSAVIQNTLKFLGKMFGEEISLVTVLASRRIELHKVFLGILEYQGKSCTPHSARLALSSVAVVIDLVLPLIKKLKNVSVYIIRSLVHILTCYTSLLQDLAPYLADHCNQLLHQVCSAALENCHDSLIPVIPFLFARLLPLTKTSMSVKESTLRVIRLVLTTRHPDVQLAAAALPPLPDDEEHKNLTTLRELHEQLMASCVGHLTLRDEVENFLSLPVEQMESHSVLHMLKQLQLHRAQTAGLYENVGVGQESVGHRLTYHLVSLASGGDEKVSFQASKCLGELGPVSLGSPVFYIQDRNYSQFLHLDSSDADIVCKIITMLNRYLTCEDFHVVQAASSALQKVLSMRDGYNAFNELGHIAQQELILLLPKTKPKAKSSSYSGVDAIDYEQLVGEPDIWFSENRYEVWVKHLACILIEADCGNEVISQVLPVCKVKPEFSAFMLPFIVHSALRTDTDKRRDVLSRQFSQFFQHHVKANKLGSEMGGNSMDICINKAALQVLLNIIDYLRAQTPNRSFSNSNRVTPWERNLWLQVNYMHVAHAAHFCGAHFSALLFLHLHCETLQCKVSREPRGKDLSVNGPISPLMQISNLPEVGDFSKLLLQVYSCLGDSDGVEGCVGSSKLIDSSARAMRYHHRGQWMEAFAIHDAVNSSFGMVEGLQELGFFNALNTFLNERSPKLSEKVSEAQWESAWRLSQWDFADMGEKWVEEGPCTVNGGVNFHQHLFHALQSLHHQDIGSVYQHTFEARQEVVKQLKLSRAESSSSIYPVLSRLQILSEVEAASECLNDSSCPTKFDTSIQNLENLWTSKKTFADVEYKYKEPILAARISTLQSLAAFHKEVDVARILHRALLTKSLLSRQSQKLGNTLGCESALLCASKLNLPQSLVWVTRLEEAHVAKCRGENQHAGQILNSLLEEMEMVNQENQQEKVLCQVLNLYGCVLMDARARSPQSIIREYFNKAVSILENSNDVEGSKVLENSYHQLATYADKLYREVHQHLESDTIQTKRENIRRSREESIRMKSLFERSKDVMEKKELSRKVTILEKNVGIDCSVLSDLEKEQQDYIYLALKNYLKCLLVSNKHDLHIYRVVGLWLENLTEEKISNLVLEFGDRMKSYQFVPLLYQLSARLSCQRDHQQTFPAVLLHLLERVCLEHPHHGLPVIFALAHAHADDEILKAGSKTKKKRDAVIEEDRVQAAKMLVNRLKRTAIADHVLEFEKVSLAYLTLANCWGTMNVRYPPGEKVKIPSTQPLFSLHNLRYTAALTRPIQLQPSTQYNPPLIVGWDNVCTFVGGINTPKRLTLQTSDGLKQFELLKGRDDIRQDAVMEQVFGIVNELLTKSSETRERALSMRTYQVVPLSQKSGLIQWCNNTQAFGEYLIGSDKKSGAHKQYYSEDFTANTCRNKMMSAKSLPLEDRCSVFQDVLEHFHPVFRHFFLENYPSPHEWYKRQLAYTKSVATNSMVGYILGLGDRHVENILLDKSTAELIHIDLGIAFELGKILPTPETIPFRMTQDIVDGLGVMGIEGPLRRCCEATLNVLRSSGEVLVTVVEVLRHDPLHQWTLTPQQVAHLQACGDDEDQGIGWINSASMADRVVLRVQQKLAGVEDGYPRTVTEQVTVLLQQATDHSNLSRLFPGWQPYI